MFFQAFEFGQKISNVIVYNDNIDETATKIEQNGGKYLVARSLTSLRKKLIEANRNRTTQGLALMTLFIPLSACGSGGSDDKDDTPTKVEVTGRAIDGYLIGSSVSLSSDPSTTVLTNSSSGEQGTFSGLFGTGSIIVTGGKDVSTGKSFTGVLRAPEGAKVITPITTLVEAVVSAAEKAGEVTITPAQAAQQVAKGLGLQSTSDLLNTDYVASGSSGQAKAAAQVASVIAVVSAGGGDEAAAAVVAKIATKISSAGEAGGKSKVLTDTTELKAAMAEVKSENAEVFASVSDAIDLDTFVDEMAEVVQTVNAKIATATSLKEIVATQNAVQESIVETFSKASSDDFDLGSLDTVVADIDAIVATATKQLETYLETAEIDIVITEEVLDTSDEDISIVALDASIIEAINDNTLDLGTIEGILDGTLDQDTVEIPADVPVVVVPIVEVPVVEVPIVVVPIVEVPVVEVPVVVAPVVSGGGGGGGGGSVYNLTTTDDIQTTIDSASNGDIISLAAGRYDQSFTISKDIEIRGANYGESVHATDDNTVAEVYFDTADAQRAGATAESWINGTVTVAEDGVTLDGLRLHAYNGPLEFSGTNIDNFTLKNSYVTGFEGSKSFRYIDNDGTTSTGWNISDNLIGGVAGGVGGSLYLTGVTNTTIDDNVFWRPGAAHMYLEDVTSLTVSNNFFLHGLHADGANKDGLLGDLATKSEWGYVGFTGGQGYGNVGGYGYGFGYGYDGSVATTDMGYGYGVGTSTPTESSGYGPTGYKPLDSAYGLSGYGGGAGTDFVFFGRNYIAEVKGTTDKITFSNNAAMFNSGGIQFWDEDNSANSFTETVISDNTFTDFINADPDGFLSSVSSRHKTGLMGGVTFSVVDGSSSSDLNITGNTFTGSIGEIRNDNDIDSLILVQGEVNDVEISTNTLSWTGDSVTSTTNLTAATARSVTYDVYTQGIHLAGDVNGAGTGKIAIQNNTFDTDTVARYISDGVLIDGSDQSSLSLGTLSSDVNIVDSGNTTYSNYIASNDFGGYKTGSDQYEPVTGTSAYSSLTVVTSATAGTDIIYSQADVI
jgi:hypothetical protein